MQVSAFEIDFLLQASDYVEHLYLSTIRELQ